MSSKRVDWTDERHRRIIEEQRKFMWTPEQLERLAAWIGFEAGWTMLDLGCGYGYLGRTYAMHVSPGGDAETWEKRWEKWGRLIEDMKKALERGELYMTGSSIFYSVRGRKPA